MKRFVVFEFIYLFIYLFFFVLIGFLYMYVSCLLLSSEKIYGTKSGRWCPQRDLTVNKSEFKSDLELH